MSSIIRGSDNFDSLVHQGIGVNQTWQDVTASRANGVTYTNSTGKPIEVIVSFNISANRANASAYVNGVRVISYNVYSDGSLLVFIVPNGSNYYITGTLGINSWLELR